MGAQNASMSCRHAMARSMQSFSVGSRQSICVMKAPLTFSLFLLAAAGAAAIPNSDSANSVVQVDFSRHYDDIEIPACARQQVVNVILADQEIACLLPSRGSSGILALDHLKRLISSTSAPDDGGTQLMTDSIGQNGLLSEQEECRRPTRLSNELHIGSPELQSYMRAARLRWLLDRCFRFSDIGVRDWRYELCIGYATKISSW